MIHCIGDSHSVFFCNHDNHPNWYIHGYPNNNPIYSPFQTHWIGAHTAYNLHKRKPIFDEVIKKFWKPNDHVLFVAGEIDCREHIVKHSKLQNRTIESVAQEACQRFFSFISSYRQYNLISFSAIPPTTICSGGGDPCHIALLSYNKELEKLANINKIPFLSIQDEIFNIPNNWYIDGTHLNPKLAIPIVLAKLKLLHIGY